MNLSRRQFLAHAAALPIAGALACANSIPRNSHKSAGRFMFTSQGKTAIMNTDGTGLEYLAPHASKQVTWQPAGFFSDGRRILLLSMEERRDGPGRPFDEYYTQSPTHIWTYDLESAELIEVATKDRLAVFCTPQLLLNDNRMLVQVVKNKVGKIYSMNLDGSDAREFTREGDGFPYGLSQSPDGSRVAFHLSMPGGYQVWTADADGGNRVKIAGAPGHLYFGTSWSPDGQWVLYVDCLHEQDPGHDWADVCVGMANGRAHTVLTHDQAMWFAATYGNPETRGGGSNLPAWTHDGQILFPRRLPDSKVPWEYQANRVDVDHFNRDFKPELAKGGTEICSLDPRSGHVTALTHSDPPVWDFRASQSPDGKQIIFCRAATGDVPAIWIMNSDGTNQRELTRGFNDLGADHPRWIPVRIG